MPLPTINPTKTAAWSKLKKHYKETKSQRLQDLFERDAKRGEQFRICWDDFYIDFSKNHLTQETLALLTELAEECQLEEAKSHYFSGSKINASEGRSVLHTALRAPGNHDVRVDGENIIPGIHAVIDQIKNFSQGVIDGTITSSSGTALYRCGQYRHWWI